MTIFLYEFRKIFTKKSAILIFILFLMLDAVKMITVYQERIAVDPVYSGKEKLIDEIKGPITHEKLVFVIERKQELDKIVSDQTYSTEYDENTYTGYQFGDWNIFREVYQSLDYAYHYSDSLQSVLKKAEENKYLYPSDSYEARGSEKILNTYQGRKIPSFYDTYGYESYFSYDFSGLLILLFLLFVLSSLFSEEKESKMDSLINSSPVGKKATIKVKLCVAVIITVFIVLIFCIFDFLLFSFLFGLEGGLNPLYSLPSFSYTAFSGSILSYCGISLILKVIGGLFFCFLFLLFSVFFSRNLPSFLCGFSAFIFMIIWYDFSPNDGCRYFSPISLFVSRLFFQGYSQTAVFGFPINTIILVLSEVLILSAIFFFIIYRLQNRNQFLLRRGDLNK